MILNVYGLMRFQDVFCYNVLCFVAILPAQPEGLHKCKTPKESVLIFDNYFQRAINM